VLQKPRQFLKTMLRIPMLMCLLLPAAWAGTHEEKGFAIIKEADARNSGFNDSTSSIRMILRDRHGQESTRIIRTRTREVVDDGDKSLLIFDTPKDVKGTALLTFSHRVGDDDQWLYLPALKRVKRISSRNKSGSFIGSEFAYEDISSQEVEKYTYKWLRDEIHESHDCFVLERYPVDKKNSGYIRQVMWIDKKEYRTLKVDYFDRKDSLLKTLTAGDYHKYLDKFWRAHAVNMVNHQNGKSTELIWSDFKFGVGLKDKDFNKNSLKNVR